VLQVFGEKSWKQPLNQHITGKRLPRRWATETNPPKEDGEIEIFPEPAADMSVTVGRIKELARHFRGEGGASFPPSNLDSLPAVGGGVPFSLR
jgi:hypothetical protein